jgi:hypothetical protein
MLEMDHFFQCSTDPIRLLEDSLEFGIWTLQMLLLLLNFADRQACGVQ